MVRIGIVFCTLVLTAVALAQTPSTKPAARTQWSIGQSINVKSGPWWEDARITNKRKGDWYLVTYKGGKREWVEWWRIRKAGSKDDIPRAQSNPPFKPGMNPPRPDAGDRPVDPKAAQAGPAAQPIAAAAKPPKEVWDKPVTPVDLSMARVVELKFEPAGSLPIDGPAEPVKVSSQSIPIQLGPGNASLKSLLNNGTALATVVRGGSEDDMAYHTVQRFDVVAGKAMPALAFPRTSVPMGISASGKRLVGREVKDFRVTPRRVDVWDISGSEVKHLVSFIADPKSMWGVQQAEFIDDDTLLTRNSDEEVVVWDLANVRPLWKTKLGVLGRIHRSLNNKYLYALSRELFCLEARTGKVLGRTNHVPGITFALRPDGKEIFVTSSLINLETGEIRSLALPGQGSDGLYTYLSDKYMLAEGALIDLEKPLIVWQYEAPTGPAMIGGRAFVAVEDNHRGVLHSEVLPHAAALKKIESVKLDEKMAIYPGAKVSLDVNIQGTREDVKTVTDDITKQIAAAGLVIQPGAPVRIVCRTELGKPVMRTWQPLGRGQKMVVQVTPKICAVRIELDGKPLWSSADTGLPVLARPEGEETLQQHLDRTHTFSYKWFSMVRFPAYLPKTLQAPTQQGFGRSSWKLKGLQDQ